jgi:hypothetical protein
MRKSEKREPKIEQEKQEHKEPEVKEREDKNGEEEEREGGALEGAVRPEGKDQERQLDEARPGEDEAGRDGEKRQEEERRRKEEDEKLRERRDEEDRLRQDERDREDRELDEQRRLEDEELTEKRRREDEEREQRVKTNQEELDRIIRLQQEYERLRNQHLEQGKDAPGSYGRSILDDKIEAAERSVDETLAAVKRPDVEHAAPSNLDRTEGSNLDGAHGALDLGRDIEDTWSLEERTGIEKEAVVADERSAEENRDLESLERELTDLDREDIATMEPQRADPEGARIAESTTESPESSETSSPESDLVATWLNNDGDKDEIAEQTIAELEHTDPPEWERSAYDEDVIERTRDLDPVAFERGDHLEQEQMAPQFEQQQMFEHENTLDMGFERDLFKAGRDREDGEREEQEQCHEGR